MCNVMEDMRNESLQKGLKEGMEKGTLRILKTDKYALEEILDIYGLSLDEIKKQKDYGWEPVSGFQPCFVMGKLCLYMAGIKRLSVLEIVAIFRFGKQENICFRRSRYSTTHRNKPILVHFLAASKFVILSYAAQARPPA